MRAHIFRMFSEPRDPEYNSQPNDNSVLLKIKTPELKLISQNAVAAAGIQTHQIPNCKSTTNRQHFKPNEKSSTGHIPWTDRVITVVDYCKSKRFCS